MALKGIFYEQGTLYDNKVNLVPSRKFTKLLENMAKKPYLFDKEDIAINFLGGVIGAIIPVRNCENFRADLDERVTIRKLINDTPDTYDGFLDKFIIPMQDIGTRYFISTGDRRSPFSVFVTTEDYKALKLSEKSQYTVSKPRP